MMGTGVVDILIRNPQQRTIALVEIDNILNLDEATATEYFLQLSDYIEATAAIYTMIVSQKIGYLWKSEVVTSPDPKPLVVFPMEPVIKRLQPDFDGKEYLYKGGLIFLIWQWLREMSVAEPPFEEPEKTIAQTDFIDKIRHMIVTFDL